MIDPDFDPYEILQQLSAAMTNQSELTLQIIRAQQNLAEENRKLLELHKKNSRLMMILEQRLNAIELSSANNSK